MKKILSFLLVLMLILSFVACGEDDENTTLRISFKVDGSSVSYEKSLLDADFDGTPSGHCFGTGEDITAATALFAGSIAESIATGIFANCILIYFDNLTNSAGDFLGVTNVGLDYTQNGVGYNIENFGLVISEFGAIGELIKGSFTATVSDSGVTNEITDGVIRVMRRTNGDTLD